MKITHLEDRVEDYKRSIQTVVEKKILWKNEIRKLILKTLHAIADAYPIGWRVQELSWIHSNEAVNITFDSFPPGLIEKTNQIPSYQFIQGGTLLFSQSYSGDIYTIILFPVPDNSPVENENIELGIHPPSQINEKLVIETVDTFLREMIKWELPSLRGKVGFH
ncbi:hypothetical protein [Ascidiimonas sp. W6]|uniref:hypothetical protein n=1 Tax=Ascidiimonas meishanensis TaxID=3128903 RepID=UPI0030EE5ECE